MLHGNTDVENDWFDNALVLRYGFELDPILAAPPKHISLGGQTHAEIGFVELILVCFLDFLGCNLG